MAYIKGQPFRPQFTDPSTGNLLENGTIEFYLTGGSTPTPYYTDSIGTSGGTSLTLDSGGHPATDIYYDTTITYKLVLKNAAGTVIHTIDPFSPPATEQSTPYRYANNTTGVDPTGATDSTTGLTNAFAAGGTVILDGTYLTSGAVTVPANTEVFGIKGAKIVHSSNTNCLVINGVDNVHLHDFTIQGSNTFRTSEILVRVLEQVDNIIIERVTCYESGRNGISIQQSAAGREPTNVHVIDCHLYDNQGNGLFYNGVNGGSITGNYIYNNGQSVGDASNVGYGIVIDAYWDNDPKDVTVTGNTVNNNTQGGIIALASEGVVIDNNTLKGNGSSSFVDAGDNYGNGIYVRWKDSSSDNRTVNTYPSDTIISNNRIKDSYGFGIKCENGEDYVIQGNSVKNSGLGNSTFTVRGIRVFSTGANLVRSFTITGNTVKQLTSGLHDIGIACRGVQYGTITGNHVFDCTTNHILLESDGTVFNIGVDISSNQLYDDNVVTDSICLEYSTQSHIHGNTIYNPLTYGVSLDANSTDNRIGENFIYGVTAGNEYNISDIDNNHFVQEWEQTSIYDFAVDGGAQGYKSIGTIPNNCYIVEAWYEVLTAMTSAGAATVEIGIQTDDTTAIAANAAYNHASYSAGLHDGVPDGTVTNFSAITTAARSIALRIQTADLTAGKVKVYWRYVQSN